MKKLKHYINKCAERPVDNKNPNEISTYTKGCFGDKIKLTIKRVSLDYTCGFCIRYEIYMHDVEVYREVFHHYCASLKKIDNLFISAKIKSNNREQEVKDRLILDFEEYYDQETKRNNSCII